MANKKILKADRWSAAVRRTAGILGIGLVFGMAFIGCKGSSCSSDGACDTVEGTRCSSNKCAVNMAGDGVAAKCNCD
jgi:hypothetical protein